MAGFPLEFESDCELHRVLSVFDARSSMRRLATAAGHGTTSKADTKLYGSSGAVTSLYLSRESFCKVAKASCTVVMNWAGKMIVEFFSVAISTIVCSVRN
jgi:hypothetical protein